MNKVVALLLAIAAFMLSSMAAANSSGLAGYTGKPNAASATGQTCNGCHTGGSAPTVSLAGPATIAAGASADFVLTVGGNTTTAGGVSGSDGVKLTAGNGFRDSFGEMVQSAPQGASGAFRFTVTAPANGTTFTLWAVGLGGASQGSSTSKAITKEITITGGGTGTNPPNPAPNTSTSSGTIPAGSGGDDDDNAATPGSSSSTSGTASSKKTTKKKPATEDDDDDDDDSDYRDRQSQFNDTQACNMTYGPTSGGSVFALFAVSLLLRRRKTWALCVLALVGCASDPAVTPDEGDDEDPSSDEARTVAENKTDTTGGRDTQSASCFAACQNTSLTCTSKSSASTSDVFLELDGFKGCKGKIGSKSISINCVIDTGKIPQVCIDDKCEDGMYSAQAFSYRDSVCTKNN